MTRMISLMALMTLAACGGASPQKVCDRAAECYEELGGDAADFDVDACVSDYEEFETQADEAGCGSEYSAALKCGLKADCDDDGSACESESTAFIECLLGASTTSSTSGT